MLAALVFLAAMAIPYYRSRDACSATSATRHMVKYLSVAIDVYCATTRQLPSQLDDLVVRPNDERVAKLWAGPYVKSVKGFMDPWDVPYKYTPKGKRNQGGYDVWSLGPDQSDGTPDDIGNWDK
jgi:general secretion pathway protein G